MKNKVLKLLKNKYFLVALAIVFFGTFLRVWNFSDWLHFELDQSRDAKVVGLALEKGIGNLPLLGPKAAGSFLRLGPLFYYMQYLSGLFFGNNPAGIAVVSLIFSCLTPILFYFFVRRYFSQKISLTLLALFSVSLFMVMYSRFAWNPNNLPFFILLFLYSLLRAVDSSEAKKGWWLILASLGFSFASQLHFVALLSLPVIGGIFLLAKRPKISWKFWLGVMLLILFFYIPPIINDFKTGGDNISEFKKVFFEKATDNKEKYTLIEKVVKNAQETTLGYFVVYSGYQKAEFPQVRQLSNLKFDIVCDKQCRENLPMGVVACFVIIAGVLCLVYNFLSHKKKEIFQKDFLILFGIWFVITLGLFVPIAYDLAPRFFLLVAPVPFVLLGLIFEFLEKRKLSLFVYIIMGVLIFSNLFLIQKRFSQMSRASVENFEIDSDKILKEKDRVTFEQQLKITDYMEDAYKQNNFPVYINSEAFYRRAFLYNLEKRNIPRDDLRNTGKEIYAEGNYFLIYPSNKSPEDLAKKYAPNYSIIEVKNFGTLTVTHLTPLLTAVNATRQEFGPEKNPTSASGVPVRCRWNEILGKCNTDGLSDENQDEE